MSNDMVDRAGSNARLASSSDTPTAALERLIEIMERLRAPDGCPWDREQSFETIAPYTIEEAYEVADAIERGDWDDLIDELGDLLLQVIYHSRIAEERGLFAFRDVAEAISEKMLRRHPHVFAGADKFDWHAMKAEERAQRVARRAAAGLPEEKSGQLDSVPTPLPALARAAKLQLRAAEVGFDWTEPEQIVEKIAEEAAELAEAARDAARPGATDAERAHVEEEMGDLFFVLANLARRLDIDPEEATRKANAKFVRRFGMIEDALAKQGRSPSEASLEEMDALWNDAKRIEREQP